MSNSTAMQTYQAIGNREDLLDVITNISPEETPMFSMFGQTKATGVYHEWLTDTLTAAAANAAVEGSDYTFARRGVRTRLGNWVQTLETSVEVSDIQRKSDSAGVDDEFAYQVAKALKEQARDIEFALASTASTGNSGASGTARTLKGVMPFISTTNTTGTAAGVQLTETLFNDCLQAIWNQGGRPDTVFANGYQKRKISGFTASSTKYLDANTKEVVVGVDIYDSDFGRVKIYADRYMNAAQVAILQKEMWKVAIYDPTHKVDVAKVGSATRGVVTTSLTLECRAESANGKLTSLATS